MHVTTAAERQLAVAHWLRSAADRGEQTNGEWQKDDILLLSCGALFSAVRIPADLVQAAAQNTDHAVIDAYLAGALLDGPVICDRYAGWYYALVPASTAQRWDVAGTVCLGLASSLGTPHPSANGSYGERVYWSVPMDSAGMLCSANAVAQLVRTGEYKALTRG